MTASYILVLGMILGAGLVLAIKSVAKTVQLRQIRREVEQEQRIQAEVDRRLGIDAWLPDYDRPVAPHQRSAFSPIKHP